MSNREFYENGYGISIICNEYSYGGREGLYEIAVLKGDEEDYNICYDTPITSDVIGYLSSTEVKEIIEKIKSLDKTPEAIVKNRDTKIDSVIN